MSEDRKKKVMAALILNDEEILFFISLFMSKFPNYTTDSIYNFSQLFLNDAVNQFKFVGVALFLFLNPELAEKSEDPELKQIHQIKGANIERFKANFFHYFFTMGGSKLNWVRAPVTLLKKFALKSLQPIYENLNFFSKLEQNYRSAFDIILHIVLQ
mmetsp:Transcript_35113/g.31619  ORF Transcript_35113/g.31619 Transcript_35113/m.31619 type:complete len:157 (+) Transcript_35113:209-679(+)